MATLTALENEIKKDNDEETKLPTYLAICDKCDYYDWLQLKKKNQFVVVHPIGTRKNTLVFFENWVFTGSTGGEALSEYPDVISLNDYMDRYISEGEGDGGDDFGGIFTTLIDVILSYIDKKEQKEQIEQMKKFFEKYIHKFIQYTYDSVILLKFKNLYGIYDTIYCNSKLFNMRYGEYITKNCSPGFSLYIDTNNYWSVVKGQADLGASQSTNPKDTTVHLLLAIIETKEINTTRWQLKTLEPSDIIELNLSTKKIYIYNPIDKNFEKFNIINGGGGEEFDGANIFKQEIKREDKAFTLADNLTQIKAHMSLEDQENFKNAYCKILVKYQTQPEFTSSITPYSFYLYSYITDMKKYLDDSIIMDNVCINEMHKEFFDKIKTFNKKYSEPIYIDPGDKEPNSALAIKSFGFLNNEDETSYILLDDLETIINGNNWLQIISDPNSLKRYIQTKNSSDILLSQPFNFDKEGDPKLLKLLKLLNFIVGTPTQEDKYGSKKLKQSLENFFKTNMEKNVKNVLFNKLYKKCYENDYFKLDNVDVPIILEIKVQDSAIFKWKNNDQEGELGGEWGGYWGLTNVSTTHRIEIYIKLIDKYSEKPLLVQVIIKSLKDYIETENNIYTTNTAFIQEILKYIEFIKKIKTISNWDTNERQKEIISTLEKKIASRQVNSDILLNNLIQSDSANTPTLEEYIKSLQEINKYLTDLKQINANFNPQWINDNTNLLWINVVIEKLEDKMVELGQHIDRLKNEQEKTRLLQEQSIHAEKARKTAEEGLLRAQVARKTDAMAQEDNLSKLKNNHHLEILNMENNHHREILKMENNHHLEILKIKQNEENKEKIEKMRSEHTQAKTKLEEEQKKQIGQMQQQQQKQLEAGEQQYKQQLEAIEKKAQKLKEDEIKAPREVDLLQEEKTGKLKTVEEGNPTTTGLALLLAVAQ